MLDVQKVNTISFSTDCQDAEGKKEKKKNKITCSKEKKQQKYACVHAQVHTHHFTELLQ